MRARCRMPQCGACASGAAQIPPGAHFRSMAWLGASSDGRGFTAEAAPAGGCFATPLLSATGDATTRGVVPLAAATRAAAAGGVAAAAAGGGGVAPIGGGGGPLAPRSTAAADTGSGACLGACARVGDASGGGAGLAGAESGGGGGGVGGS